MDNQNIPSYNCCLIDWLSVTFKPQDISYYDDVDFAGNSVFGDSAIKMLLGLQDVEWEERDHGVKGFGAGCYFAGITIHRPSLKLSYYWLDMSGSGCRAFDEHNHSQVKWYALLNFCLKYGNITRLDIAFDDHTGILDMPTLMTDTLFLRNYVSKSRIHTVESSIDDNSGRLASTIYHGSPSSNTLIRIYDKSAERHLPEDVHWTRLELQLRNNNSCSFVKKMIEQGPTENFGNLFLGVLNNYLRYVEPSADTNKTRWSNTDYWDALVGDIARIKIFEQKGVEYNRDRLEKYVFTQCGNSVRALWAMDGKEFLQKLRDSGGGNPFGKYKNLVDNHGCDYLE